MDPLYSEKMVYSEAELSGLVMRYGFLPFMKNRVNGFSVEEHTPPELWFAQDRDGPWEWKGPVIQQTGCAYGRFFAGKAGFITRDWYYDYACFRRNGYDPDAAYEDGTMRHLDKVIYDAIADKDSMLSKEWRRYAGISRRGDFDAAVIRLQMQGYIITTGFEYSTDAFGKPYGWGIARYATPERYFGKDFTEHIYDKDPEESKTRILQYLAELLPEADMKHLIKTIGNIQASH